MKFPNHISLDLKNSLASNSFQYWIINYLKTLNDNSLSSNLHFNKTFFIVKKNLLLNDLIKNQKKFTLALLHSNFSKKNYKSKKLLLSSKSSFKNSLIITDNISNTSSAFKTALKNIFKVKIRNNTNKSWSLFNVNFLKKERIYTKLKYSRTPQYDIVSGGSAALLAGFLGFLITEKFGFELIDSGDFYFLFMYIVFVSFFSRVYVRLMDQLESSWSIISPKWFFLHYHNMFSLLIKYIRYVKLLILR
jgi:hypothetical protein